MAGPKKRYANSPAGKKPADISYNPYLPGGRPQDEKRNQRARIKMGDNLVMDAVANDYNANYGGADDTKMARKGRALTFVKRRDY